MIRRAISLKENAMSEDPRAAELDNAVRRFGEAWAKGDVATIDSLLSATYTHGDVLGDFQDKAEWLAYAGGRAGRGTRISFSDVRTRIIGDVAVVTGINTLTGGGALSAADRHDLELRFTQLWIWRNGSWLREAFQGTLMQKGSAPPS